MNCPSCRSGYLKPAYLEEQFLCHTCSSCGGNWILLRDYLAWRDKHPDFHFEEPSIEASAHESKQALICPVSGALMLKYRISKDNDHRIDLSPKVYGIWLDKGEWELLKAEGLAGSLNSIFTEPWQRHIREESAKEVFEALYLEEFGEADYSKIKAMRAWIDAHPEKHHLLAYLLADDPYSAQH